MLENAEIFCNVTCMKMMRFLQFEIEVLCVGTHVYNLPNKKYSIQSLQFHTKLENVGLSLL